MIADAIQQERENLCSEIYRHILHVHLTQATPAFAQYQLPSAICPRDQDNPHDDALLEGENSAKRREDLEHRVTFELGGYIIWSDYEKLNQKGIIGLEKIVMSLHKFPAVIFPDDDIEEITSRWVKKCVKKFNPYAWYNFEHWKNPHAKIFYIKKQQETRKPKTAQKKRRVDRHARSHSSVNVTLKRVLKGLKSYNNNVKYGYVTPSLSHEDAEYLQLFKERIKE
ncbi:hypothetical protein Tco_1066816 [Tanacetum coccineum]|uniref:Transposase n=1 Tax=Tanacetum coccineum TaxID=301880 RepID=A0ABQ5HBY6_9ASTR